MKRVMYISTVVILILVVCASYAKNEAPIQNVKSQKSQASDLTIENTAILSDCTCAGIFETMDVNLNEFVDIAEWLAYFNNTTEFSSYDTNADAKITLTEWATGCSEEKVCEWQPNCPNC